MKYKKLKDLEKEDFKRYCGVSRETFEEMVKVEKILQEKSGRPSKLTIERVCQVNCVKAKIREVNDPQTQ